MAVVVVGLSALGLYASADSESGEDVAAAGYVAVALPEPEPPPTTEAVELETELIDLSQFGTDKPDGLVGGLVFDLLVAQGADPQQAVCTAVTLLERVPEAEILALGAEALDDPRVRQTALDCAIAEEIIEATIEAGLTG